MLLLVLAVVFLVLSHAVPSSPAVRGALIDRVGRRRFVTVYSLISLAALILVILAYRAADDTWLHVPLFEARYVALAVMPFALFLLVCRLTRPPARANGCGIYRITTVPGSLAVLLWASVHLLNVGQTRTVILFLGMFAIALISLVRNARLAGQGVFRGAVPFARIVSGDERFAPGEIGWGPALMTAAITAAILMLHPLVFGVDPLGGIW
jgi:uncharacterized membrane protein